MSTERGVMMYYKLKCSTCGRLFRLETETDKTHIDYMYNRGLLCCSECQETKKIVRAREQKELGEMIPLTYNDSTLTSSDYQSIPSISINGYTIDFEKQATIVPKDNQGVFIGCFVYPFRFFPFKLRFSIAPNGDIVFRHWDIEKEYDKFKCTTYVHLSKGSFPKNKVTEQQKAVLKKMISGIEFEGLLLKGSDSLMLELEMLPDPNGMSIKTARERAGLTKNAMSLEFDIPISTLNKWESGVSSPPEWAWNLIMDKLERISTGDISNIN